MMNNSPSSPPSANWPLDANERLLWEDSIDPAAPINRVVPFFRSRFLWGFFLLLLATDRLFPPVVKRAGRDCAHVYFAARSGSKQPRRPNVFNAIGFRDLSVADLPAALAALRHAASRHE